MNLLSFVDELVKVGACRCMYKRAADMTSGDPPAGMMDPAPAPPFKRVVPDEASTRTANAHRSLVVQPGAAGGFGSVAGTKKHLDEERFNRPYVERR